ncbi:hypothetical protein BX070DRAFT_221823 [Coemansia spiralis]|nr:hypothetical protein BX070DRAFT_221823 [Coemansia spiralis]
MRPCSPELSDVIVRGDDGMPYVLRSAPKPKWNPRRGSSAWAPKLGLRLSSCGLERSCCRSFSRYCSMLLVRYTSIGVASWSARVSEPALSFSSLGPRFRLPSARRLAKPRPASALPVRLSDWSPESSACRRAASCSLERSSGDMEPSDDTSRSGGRRSALAGGGLESGYRSRSPSSITRELRTRPLSTINAPVRKSIMSSSSSIWPYFSNIASNALRKRPWLFWRARSNSSSASFILFSGN